MFPLPHSLVYFSLRFKKKECAVVLLLLNRSIQSLLSSCVEPPIPTRNVSEDIRRREIGGTARLGAAVVVNYSHGTNGSTVRCQQNVNTIQYIIFAAGEIRETNQRSVAPNGHIWDPTRFRRFVRPELCIYPRITRLRTFVRTYNIYARKRALSNARCSVDIR